MGDDQRRRAKLAVDLLDRIENEDAGLAVERAGRLVAQQHPGFLGDRSRNGDALLLAAGKLGRKMVQPAFQADQRQRLRGVHRILRDLGDQGDVFERRERCHQIVELEDESDMRPAIFGQRPLIEAGQFAVLEPDMPVSR
jgi:hypothetical protein